MEGAFHDIPRVDASRCATVCGLNITEEYIDYLGISGEKAEKMKKGVRDMHAFMQKIGINDTFCCAPQILGHFPLKGEHTVTGESSQVVFQNSVMGARCNCEGMVVHGCAAMLGKIPNTGYHITENRWGTHLIKVECIPKDVLDWDILGYWIGKKVGVGVPVIDVDVPSVSLDAHKSLGTAICSGGQVDMYHILGLTPEAGTLDMAFGKNTPKAVYTYTEKDREETLKFLNFSSKTDVDMVILGCPQYSIYQVRDAARYLEGKHCKARLVVQTPQMLIDQARKNGDAQLIEAAGGFLLADTCVPMCGLWPENVTCVATDSVKNACYIPGDRPDIEIHMGTMEQCAAR